MRIVLSRTDRIGDLVLSTPAIATVRRSFPEAHLTVVTSPYNQVVLERNADVDALVALPRAVRPAAFGATFRGYDLAVALAPRAADLQLIGATRAPVRVGYTYERRWVARLTARAFVTRLMVSEADPRACEQDPTRHVRHEVDQLLDLVGLAGATERVSSLRLDLRPEDRAAVADLPAAPIALHLGSRWFSQGSTVASTLELTRRLRALGPLVITVAPECGRLADPFLAPDVADRALVALPFFAWAAVFERARCVVTVDTGATHVASALRRPTLVAFEHRYFRLNSQEWAPYGVPHVLVRKPAFDDDASLARFRDEIVDGVATLSNHA